MPLVSEITWLWLIYDFPNFNNEHLASENPLASFLKSKVYVLCISTSQQNQDASYLTPSFPSHFELWGSIELITYF